MVPNHQSESSYFLDKSHDIAIFPGEKTGEIPWLPTVDRYVTTSPGQAVEAAGTHGHGHEGGGGDAAPEPRSLAWSRRMLYG